MSALKIKKDNKKGRIWSHVRGKWLVETPEEAVRPAVPADPVQRV